MNQKEEAINFILAFFIVVVIAGVIGLGASIFGWVTNAATPEPTECTTAPVETSVPEPTETIHIEATEGSSEAPSAPVTDETVFVVDQGDLDLLACVIYQEAGGNGSCDDCRRYVADIVLNRVNDPRFPDSIYEVLTAEGQYGKFHWTGVVWPERASYPEEVDAVARAYRIAEEVLSGQHSELYGNDYIWQAGFVQGSDGFWCCGHFYGR